ncbi:MAG: electron transfer flavoprotein subunit alpha/FixB family protein [bacterium]
MLENSSKEKKIVVFSEKIDGKESNQNVTLELLSTASFLTRNRNFSVVAVSFNDDKAEHDLLAEAGADKVVVASWEKEEKVFNLELLALVASELIKKLNPEIVFFGATDFGRALAPKVAAIIKCGITADCTGFEINGEGKLVQIRPALGGNILAHIVSSGTFPQMATVRPRVFKIKKHKKKAAVEKVFFEIPKERKSVVVVDKTTVAKDLEKIEDASIVVSAGYGVKSKELLKKIEVFAKNIGGVLACSRKLVELGWLNHSRQVGQSGKTITPEIYIAIRYVSTFLSPFVKKKFILFSPDSEPLHPPVSIV